MVAKSVDLIVCSEQDIKKYGEDSDSVFLAPWTPNDQKSRTFQLPSAPTWTGHIGRRTRGKAAGETPDDEAFYRGLLLAGSEKGLDLEATFRAMFKNELGSESSLVELGHMVERVANHHAKESVQFSGKIIQVGPYKARIVAASMVPVMPTVIAAAQDVDMGISHRYNYQTDTTQVTFYTLHPDKVDLGFLHKAPFHVGGRPDCKGKTIKGKVDVELLLSCCFDTTTAKH